VRRVKAHGVRQDIGKHRIGIAPANSMRCCREGEGGDDHLSSGDTGSAKHRHHRRLAITERRGRNAEILRQLPLELENPTAIVRHVA